MPASDAGIFLDENHRSPSLGWEVYL